MAIEKMKVVNEKFAARLDKGNMIELPWQVIRDLKLEKHDLVEFEFCLISDDDGDCDGFTVKKKVS